MSGSFLSINFCQLKLSRIQKSSTSTLWSYRRVGADPHIYFPWQKTCFLASIGIDAKEKAWICLSKPVSK